MNLVFAQVFLDEDVDLIVANMLRSHGFDVLTTQEAGRKAKSDPDQLAFATGKGYVILTHNRKDYEVLAVEYFESARSHAGIIISVQRSSKEITRRVLLVLNRNSAAEMIDLLYYI